MALPARRLSALADGVVVLHPLDGRRNLDTGERRPPPADPHPGRSRPGTERRRQRQPVGEDDRKGGDRGYDGGKKVNGRKRHILVDTEGLLIRIAVLAAGIADREGATDVLDLASPVCPRLAHIWADGGYRGYLATWVQRTHGWTLAVVKRAPAGQGFVVQPRRWVVERTFGWLGRSRRLRKDDEELAETTETWVSLAMLRLMLRRLAT